MNKTLLIAALALAGCAHLTQFQYATPDATADTALAAELDRLDHEVRACYAKVIISDPVPLEVAVDESGAPLAAKVTGPLFGSTLGGCIETVAFRVNLGQGNGRRLAHAIAHLKPAPTGEGLATR